MKNKNELVPFDYVREQLGLSINKMSEEVCLDCAIEISFFTLGQIILDNDEINFRKLISTIEQGMKSSKKQRNRRKAG